MVESRNARGILFDEFKCANEILREELDLLIEKIRTTEEEVYHHYHAVCLIKDLGGHSSKDGKKNPLTVPQP